ncbi:MAG: rhodanese-like domain-containing protein, partial [Thiobacillaceae bacterium]
PPTFLPEASFIFRGGDNPTMIVSAALLILASLYGPAYGDEKPLLESLTRCPATEPIENWRIQPDALQDDPREDFYFTLDVRTPHEFEAEHIRGALNHPYYELTSHLGRLPRARSEAILVYCESAQHSSHALMTLRLLGFDNVWYLNGGNIRSQRERRTVATPFTTGQQP